jgi:hypothetical protein
MRRSTPWNGVTEDRETASVKRSGAEMEELNLGMKLRAREATGRRGPACSAFPGRAWERGDAMISDGDWKPLLQEVKSAFE